uniref:DUF1758 domain-containing protein n=1 Tax=Trichuris muris TaxID=70415 RepID=A0A5S6QN79_TRIMR
MAKEHHVCFICLRKGHSSVGCDDRTQCCKKAGCTQLHNRLLHYGKIPRSSVMDTRVMPGEDGPIENEVRIGLAKTVNGTILLQTAQARLVAPNGNTALVMCLLDVGSQRSFVRKDLADNLGLKGTSECISILTFGNRQVRHEVTRSVTFSLTAVTHGRLRKWLSALCVRQICEPIGTNPPLMTEWTHLHGCHLADQFPRNTTEIDVLIGADYYYDFVSKDIRKGAADEPVAVQSVFGWILCGKTGRVTNKAATALLCRISEEESANLLLQRFWQLDAIGIAPDESRDSSNAECQYSKWPIQFNGERYIVTLPWRSEMKLPNNYSYVLQRLEQVENQMKRKPEERQVYIATIQEYIDKGWVEEVPLAAEKGKVWYLPHHAIIRVKDSVKKCRIVFDGSASYRGFSLNDMLSSGPTLQNDLLAILLRYRRFRIAIQADIEAMFLQIELQPKDRDFVRFLWRRLEPHERLMTMRFTRVCFGLKSSPFLAMAVIRKLALDKSAQYRKASAEVLRNMYVDDLLSSFSTEEDALSVSTEATALLKAGGFRLHKWRSNSETVMKRLANCS